MKSLAISAFRGTIGAAALLAVGAGVAADTVALNPVKDNTLFFEATGATSNGAGGLVAVGCGPQHHSRGERRCAAVMQVRCCIPDTDQCGRIEADSGQWLADTLPRRCRYSPDIVPLIVREVEATVTALATILLKYLLSPFSLNGQATVGLAKRAGHEFVE